MPSTKSRPIRRSKDLQGAIGARKPNGCRILLIGGGPATVSLLTEFAARAEDFCTSHITIIERTGLIGPGTPHRGDNSSQLVNMRNALHSIPGCETFESFLVTRGFDPDVPAPRHMVGEYLALAGMKAIGRLKAAGVTLQVVKGQASEIQSHYNGFRVKTSEHQTLFTNFIVLATGHDPASIPSRGQIR